MTLKKKLGMGIASAALGLSLVGGGTFAYFSDSVDTENTFAAGTLNLSIDPSVIIDVNNIKPGDKMPRRFYLVNDGSLDISRIDLNTSYEVIDTKNDNNGEDFAEHIKVNFLDNDDKNTHPIFTTTLADLDSSTIDLLQENGWTPDDEEGLKSGEQDTLFVEFEFVDNGFDQNIFQGDILKLTWTFDAHQTEGEER
ncbi:TasA family protein [Bacillus sp. SM2101]|uniref:TasA family protein n=1 Tax=Bacillaceae TaxID=186817 RepID=UPI001BDF55E5|nr:TasA family protein [Bacillus sp. SM2101]